MATVLTMFLSDLYIQDFTCIYKCNKVIVVDSTPETIAENKIVNQPHFTTGQQKVQCQSLVLVLSGDRQTSGEYSLDHLATGRSWGVVVVWPLH